MSTIVSTTHESREVLINLVKTYPCLYDIRSKEYHDRTVAENARVEIASELTKLKAHGEWTAAEVQKTFKNLKDYYHQIKRDNAKLSRSGSGDTPDQPKRKRKEWPLFKTMTWLDDYTTRTSTETSIRSQSASNVAYSTEEPCSSSTLPASKTPQTDLPEPTPKKSKKTTKKTDIENPIVQHMSDMKDVFRDLATQLNSTSSPGATAPQASHMALAIDEALQRVPLHQKMRCQIDIFEVLEKYTNPNNMQSTSSMVGSAMNFEVLD